MSAGIAIYKAVDLASQLTKRGDTVYTLLTPNARRFIAPLTFRGVTQEPVFTDVFEDDPEYRPEHISLSEWGQAMVAEIEHIDGRAERWRFALGCARVALIPPRRADAAGDLSIVAGLVGLGCTAVLLLSATAVGPTFTTTRPPVGLGLAYAWAALMLPRTTTASPRVAWRRIRDGSSGSTVTKYTLPSKSPATGLALPFCPSSPLS